jgi:ADP-heptose:LPS heptosyltransferase
VLANAKACVLPEGAMHHACAALNTPAVVIYGGYISPAVTGYDTQTSLFTGGDLGCGMRHPCRHCDRAMASIKPETVADHLTGLLNEASRRCLVA